MNNIKKYPPTTNIKIRVLSHGVYTRYSSTPSYEVLEEIEKYEKRQQLSPV